MLNGILHRPARRDRRDRALRHRSCCPTASPGLHYKLPWPVDRLTRIQARRVRVVEIGFRTNATTPDAEPAAYEWNVQHRSGRFQRKPEEALMLTGDQNMIELNATVHYDLAQPDDFVFGQLDGDATVRAAAESVMQSVVTSARRSTMCSPPAARPSKQRVKSELQRAWTAIGAGIRVLR